MHDEATCVGELDDMSCHNSKLTRHEDFELFHSDEVEKFLTDLVRSRLYSS